MSNKEKDLLKEKIIAWDGKIELGKKIVEVNPANTQARSINIISPCALIILQAF